MSIVAPELPSLDPNIREPEQRSIFESDRTAREMFRALGPDPRREAAAAANRTAAQLLAAGLAIGGAVLLTRKQLALKVAGGAVVAAGVGILLGGRGG